MNLENAPLFRSQRANLCGSKSTDYPVLILYIFYIIYKKYKRFWVSFGALKRSAGPNNFGEYRDKEFSMVRVCCGFYVPKCPEIISVEVRARWHLRAKTWMIW
jgi:hypothetical protein